MKLSLLSVPIRYEEDVVAVRQRTRDIADILGFDTQQQTRLATAVSEIARNAFTYAKGGKAEYLLEGNSPPQLFSVRVTDTGCGIPNLEQILHGNYRSKTGMGLGIIGAQRLMDQFQINSVPGKGTDVTLGKLLPRRTPLITPETLPALVQRISFQKPKTVLEEFREQNQELLRTMDELRRRQDELSALNRELEDTNRGVVALYAELDEKANHLRRADDMKSRFLSNVSHEFRTPLNSILALSKLLIERTDGDLSSEQEIQVSFIRKSAESLSELVNDLLDIAKVEAGKIEIRPIFFEASSLFGALRGMLKPLLASNSLTLLFESATNVPEIYSDEGKVSQILRNFISNALKFTESGEVRVSAQLEEDAGFVRFEVQDTGIGIASEHLEDVFQEFTQLDSYLQRRVKGTGLGLPLSRKLAELLGGSVGVTSQLGVGSTFFVRIPLVFAGAEAPKTPRFVSPAVEGGRDCVLVVEDHLETQDAYRRQLEKSNWNVATASSVRQAEAVVRQLTPDVILLDIRLQGEDTWNLLAQWKSNMDTRNVPVIVITTADDRSKAMALGAAEFLLKPVDGDTLRETMERVHRRSQRAVLLVDDEEASRYLNRQLFGGSNVRFLEAKDGVEALASVRESHPDLIILDLDMTQMNGFQVVEALQADANLRGIPVVISSSVDLAPTERAYLSSRVLAILRKETLLEPETTAVLATALTAAGLGDLIIRDEGNLTHEARDLVRGRS